MPDNAIPWSKAAIILLLWIAWMMFEEDKD